MNDNIELTREERLKIYAKEQMYEIGVSAQVFNNYVIERTKAIMEHPEFTAQEIFTLFGAENTQRTILFTRMIKEALAVYDSNKYPNIPVDLSGINLS